MDIREKKNTHIASSPVGNYGESMAYKKLYKNGRDRGVKGGLSQIKTEMQESLAYNSLTASAHRVLLYSHFLNYYAASKNTGQPVFKFTNRTARLALRMNQQTFSRAKQELADKGFWIWVKRGGLKGCNGIASEFALAGDWKTWQPPVKN